MSHFVIASNGEIIETGSGIVQGFETSNFPSLRTNTKNLLRHFDGISAEPLGSIPKVIALSRAEEKLVSRLHPWKWFKYATRMDYLNLLDKINKNRFRINASIRAQLQWDDPNSLMNSKQRSDRLSRSLKAYYAQPEAKIIRSNASKKAWADPNSKFNSPDHAIKLSECSKLAWADPDSGLNSPETRQKMSDRAKERCVRMTPHERVKANRKNSNAMKRHHAWKRLPEMFKMVLG